MYLLTLVCAPGNPLSPLLRLRLWICKWIEVNNLQTKPSGKTKQELCRTRLTQGCTPPSHSKSSLCRHCCGIHELARQLCACKLAARCRIPKMLLGHSSWCSSACLPQSTYPQPVVSIILESNCFCLVQSLPWRLQPRIVWLCFEQLPKVTLQSSENIWKESSANFTTELFWRFFRTWSWRTYHIFFSLLGGPRFLPSEKQFWTILLVLERNLLSFVPSSVTYMLSAKNNFAIFHVWQQSHGLWTLLRVFRPSLPGRLFILLIEKHLSRSQKKSLSCSNIKLVPRHHHEVAPTPNTQTQYCLECFLLHFRATQLPTGWQHR